MIKSVPRRGVTQAEKRQAGYFRVLTCAFQRPIKDLAQLAQGPIKLQPAGRVGPKAALTKTLLFKYQIAV
ncbi:MAG: hypothetical protein Udaeo2_02800 [Candidatus Udaeobacter sp.]|nr:MAG: hypothetical protein Udaeo2_02800 [Candidatus Udaeobacter sp.]